MSKLRSDQFHPWVPILPPTYRRARRRWHCEGIALLSAAAGKSGPHWESPEIRVALAKRLHILVEWLDCRIVSAISVAETRDRRDVVVFDYLVYRVDRATRTVQGGYLNEDRVVLFDEGIELLNPLCTGWWLRPLIKRLGLFGLQPQADLFLPLAQHESRESWLVDTAYALLKRDRRFRLLRKELRRALKLDPELVRIALACRCAGLHHRGLPSDLYSLVWRHEDDMRQIARLAPQLLPIAALGHEDDLTSPSPQPLGALRDLFANSFGKATWRYLVRHRARIFNVPWKFCTEGDSWLNAAESYLLVLSAAGLPPPPPPAIVRALVGRHREILFDCDCDVPSNVLAIALQEADRRRRQPGMERFVDDFMSVCQWAVENVHAAIEVDRKTAWHSLLKRAKEWESKQLLLAQNEGVAWECHFTRGKRDDFVIEPLNSAAAVVEEAFAMRHCGAKHIEDCRAGELRFFSVRKPENAKRLATLSIARAADGLWHVHEIAGFANQPVGKKLQQLGQAIARDYSTVGVIGTNTMGLNNLAAMESNPSSEPKPSQEPPKPLPNPEAEASLPSNRLTPSEIESLRNEKKHSLGIMMKGREHLIV